MTHDSYALQPHAEPRTDAPPPGEPGLWIVSRDRRLLERIVRLLVDRIQPLATVDPAELEKEDFWTGRTVPKLILLDIGANAAWGGQVIRRMRRARVESPVVILTEQFTRDFGAQVISEGIRYYFSHDFCDGEFLELVLTLMK
ncbi:MAG: response regulator [bacterium]|nr:response regulator [bacterium]